MIRDHRDGYDYRCRKCDLCRGKRRERTATWRRSVAGTLPLGDPRHGANGYSNYYCRCEICVSGVREQKASSKLAPNDPRHGTANGYNNHYCRCQPCREAHRINWMERKERRLARRTAAQ